jgi:phosphocarrier protein
MTTKKKPDSVQEEVQKRSFTVINKLGIHARPAALFVKTASKFTSDILVESGQDQVNGKSIMGLMMLAAGLGTKLQVTATGPDAKAALDAIGTLFERKFDEE